MPRKDRRETVCDGSIHHITQRGLDRSQVFKVDEDYLSLKAMIRRYLERVKVRIYNYCIMPNHIHLLLFAERASEAFQVYASRIIVV